MKFSIAKTKQFSFNHTSIIYYQFIHTLACLVFLVILSGNHVVVVQADDLIIVFDWTITDCNDYPFTQNHTTSSTTKKIDACGVLEYCTVPGINGVGYRQVHKDGTPMWECTTPGPTFRLRSGKKYLLTLQNTVPGTSTNIHTHGLHVLGDGNGDNALREASTNQCIHYVWDIRADHMGGTFWYHSHYHGFSYAQTTNGAIGLVIVEDDYENNMFPTDIVPTQRLPIQTFLDSDISIMAGRVKRVWRGNGNFNGAEISIKRNEWTRLRIGISNPDQDGLEPVVLPISISNCEKPIPDAGKNYIGIDPNENTFVIAYDGVYLNDIPGRSLPIGITGSSRLDVAIRCGNTGGGRASVFYGSDRIGQIIVSEENGLNSDMSSPYVMDGDTIKGWKPARSNYVRDLREPIPPVSPVTSTSGNPSTSQPTQSTPVIKIDHYMNLTFANFKINDVTWDQKVPLASYPFNSIHEWTLIGTAGHPFHFHIHHVQVVSPCGSHDIRAYYDTIAGSEDCVVRFAMVNYPGKMFMHCHDLSHEDGGMMSFIQIRDGPTIPVTNPEVNDRVCYSSISASPTKAPTLSNSNSNKPCGLFGLNIFCKDGCGVIGRLFGTCKKK